MPRAKQKPHHRWCTKCGESKPVSDFKWADIRICKHCMNADWEQSDIDPLMIAEAERLATALGFGCLIEGEV